MNFAGFMQLLVFYVWLFDLKTLFIIYYTYVLSQFLIEIIEGDESPTKIKYNGRSYEKFDSIGFSLYIDYVKDQCKIKHKDVFEKWEKDSEIGM